MEKTFIKNVCDYVASNKLNYISKEDAISKDYIGTRIFDEPLLGFGDAFDVLFDKLKDKEVIGEHFRLPSDWNDKAKTVISIFLPFTDEIIKSNATDFSLPSHLWLHGRVEGQKFAFDLANYIINYLGDKGYKSVCPIMTPEFFAVEAPKDNLAFTSNWSERHVAYVCGLGTFGLSKGIITNKGMAGRFISIVTECDFSVTTREYSSLYENCIMCGLCTKRCPVGAITMEGGKDHVPCDKFIEEMKIKFAPRYACGKCQVKLPCTSRNPSKKNK